MNRFDWVYGETTPSSPEILHFADNIGKSPVIASLLANRGIKTAIEYEKFNNKSPSDLYSPFLMQDMEKAVSRINLALENHEHITIYGDYDVDGITSVSVLVSYLQEKGGIVDYYIPDRLDEGYGINPAALCSLFEGGTTLLITVDTGITAVKEIETACYMGMDVIVTDHHRCKDETPNCVAVINPAVPGCSYPFKKLAGVGVVFKLLCALEGNSEAVLEKYGDIIALGTVADVVELTDENRIIVDFGLKKLRETGNIGLKSLITSIGIDSLSISVATIGYSLAPKINAVGRIGDASVGVKLLLAETLEEAEEISAILIEENKNRQELEKQIYEEASKKVASGSAFQDKPILVVWGENWHHGVIGIVAAKISEKYSKPCILITIDGNMAKGSGRSVEGFNLFEALSRFSDIFVKFGGHALAAGLTLKTENLPLLDKYINDYAKEIITDASKKQALNIDFDIPSRYINLNLTKELELMDPCGSGNPSPVFSISGCKVVHSKVLSDGKHLRMLLEKDGKTINTIAFGLGDNYKLLIPGDYIDVAGTLNINIWNGNTQVQFIVQDMRYSPVKVDVSPVPIRDDFAFLYTFLRKNSINGIIKINKSFMLRKIMFLGNKNFDDSKIRLCLDIFAEQRLITYADTGRNYDIFLMDSPQKVDLEASPLLINFKKQSE